MTGNTSPVQTQARFRLGFTSRVVSSLALVAAFAFVGGQQAQAAIIVEYNGDSNAPHYGADVTSKDPLVTATNLSVHGNATVEQTNSGFYRTADWSQATTFQTGDYIQFTVTASPGYELTLTSWEFKETRAGNGPRDSRLRVSFDGFNTVAHTTNRGVDNTQSAQSYSLGSITGSEATFRMYFWDARGTSSTTHYLDDLAIHGTVNLVPEPASLGLLGLGLACLVGGRSQRRRRSAAACPPGGGAE